MDLERWPQTGTSLAVLGHPITHSLSPPMHNAALAELALEDNSLCDWTYYKFDISPADLEQALHAFHSIGFRGLNLTVPHKILAAQWVKTGEPEVELTGACNTLLWEKDRYTGFNTDLYGLVQAVESDFSISLEGQEIILLGAGGAARAAAVACAQAGVNSLKLINRTLEKLQPIADTLRAFKPDLELEMLPIRQPFHISTERPLVINATSLGLKESDPAPIDLAVLPYGTRVFDMIYNPPRTRLLQQAESLGMQVSNGLGMLAYQGERSLKIWTQKNPSAKTMFEAALAGLNQSQ